jgi:hypothetical protein
VLEQVGEARAALALIARANLITDRDGIKRGEVVLGHDHAQPVVEPGVGELHLGQSGRGLLGKRQGGGGEDKGRIEFHGVSLLDTFITNRGIGRGTEE